MDETKRPREITFLARQVSLRKIRGIEFTATREWVYYAGVLNFSIVGGSQIDATLALIRLIRRIAGHSD
jgi:hypothetical protein